MFSDSHSLDRVLFSSKIRKKLNSAKEILSEARKKADEIAYLCSSDEKIFALLYLKSDWENNASKKFRQTKNKKNQ